MAGPGDNDAVAPTSGAVPDVDVTDAVLVEIDSAASSDCDVKTASEDESSETSESAGEAEAKTGDKDADKSEASAEAGKPKLALPAWFAPQCVLTATDLANRDTRVDIRDTDSWEAAVASHKVKPVHLPADTYQIESVLYDQLRDLVGPTSEAETGWRSATSEDRLRFVHDAALLRFPEERKGLAFLQAVTERFAKDIGADLLLLPKPDLAELARTFAHQEEREKLDDREWYLDTYFKDDYTNPTKQEREAQKAKEERDAKKAEEEAKAEEAKKAEEEAKKAEEEAKKAEEEAKKVEEEAKKTETEASKTADAVEEESTQESKDEPKEESKDESKEESKEESKDESKEESKDEAKESEEEVTPKPTNEEEPKSDETAGESSESSGEVSADTEGAKTNESTEEATKETTAETPVESTEESSDKEEDSAEEEPIIKPADFPWELVFSALPDSSSTARPLIILLPQLWFFVCNTVRTNILSDLSAFVAEKRPTGTTILIATDRNITAANPYSESSDDNTLGMMGSKPLSRVLRLVPVKTHQQRELLETDLELTTARNNQRTLQRRLRRKFEAVYDAPSMQPYADWGLSEESRAVKWLQQKQSDESLNEVVDLIGENVDLATLERAIKTYEHGGQILEKWGSEERASRWATLPPKIRNVIARIEADEKEYEYEIKLLKDVVIPGTIEESWDDIELEPETKKSIIQMVNLSTSDRSKAYGILKKSSIRGALLYGPPGTGKTQLARVLAREAGAVMINASFAEIQSVWVGETEKIIKALFRLARMLTPCIIFMDEADALFRARGCDWGWERSRMSQLLAETDGLSASAIGTAAPFLLLATNYPHSLDNAILRRVPGRLYIGLPTVAARETIFRICLRDEVLDDGLSVKALAARTARYTGSDIRTVCIQAALIAEDEIELRGGGDRRVLRREHFEAALRRAGPTTSKSLLTEIKGFAKEYDPSALPKIETW